MLRHAALQVTFNLKFHRCTLERTGGGSDAGWMQLSVPGGCTIRSNWLLCYRFSIKISGQCK